MLYEIGHALACGWTNGCKYLLLCGLTDASLFYYFICLFELKAFCKKKICCLTY